MQADVFETMRQAALAATNRKDGQLLRTIFERHKGSSPGLPSAQILVDALHDAGAPYVPVDSSEAEQHFARLAVTNHGYLTFDEFRRAVEQPDSLEAWLDEEATFKLGALAPALRAAVKIHQASSRQERIADPALAPLLAFSEMDEGTVASAIDSSIEAIKKQLLARQSSLRRIFQSKARAHAKRDEFECGQMQVGTIHDFYEGLQGRVGMHEEHCLKGGFDLQFNSGNPYKIDTQPHLEWKYVVSDESGQRLPCPPLPINLECGISEIPTNRSIKCPHELLKLDLAQKAGLSLEEIIAVILYSGPMFVVYNCILRHQSQPSNLYQLLVSRQNLFSTTIFVLGSALQKLSRCTRIPNGTPMFRGLGGQGKFTIELPTSFYASDDNGCSGYMDFGFQSWTADKATGLQYSGVFQNKPNACMLEIESSSIDRGADISQFSQFPGEKEYTLVPCSFVQRCGGARAQLVSVGDQFGYLSVVSARINVNLKIETLEDLLEKKKATHLTSFRMLHDETKAKHAALLQDAVCNHADGHSLIDCTMKQVDDVIKQHRGYSRIEYADDLKYSQLVFHMMQVLAWSKEKLFLWLESDRDRSSSSIDDSVETLSLADSHRLWQAHLHKKFAGAARGGSERKKTAIQLLQSRGLMNSGDADDAVDSVPLVIKAAAQNWSDSDVEYLLAAFDVRMHAGWTPAMAAAANGHADLLEGLGDLNECDQFGVFPLFLASAFGHAPCIEKILRQSTTHVNKLNSLGFSCLDVAHANGHTHCVELLKHRHFKQPINLDMRVSELQDIVLQLLQHFVLKSDSRGLAEIVKKGASANVETCDSSGQSIINFASCRGAVAAVELLLNFKADVNKCDKDGKSPLGNAQKNGHLPCVAVLEAAGATLSVLELAVAGDAVMIKRLVGHRADVNMRDSDGLSPLHYAALYGRTNCVETLVELGANVNACASNCQSKPSVSSMYSPLHCAALRAHVSCIEALAKLGADMNICNQNGESAIHSVYSGSKGKTADILQCIDVLARCGTDVNLRSKTGWTALYPPTCALFFPQVLPEAQQDATDVTREERMSANISCIQVLLNWSADVNLCDGMGKSPLQRAREKRFAEIEATLLAAGAELSLFDAATTGDLVAIKHFLRNGISGQALNQTALCSHATPLDTAAKHSHAEAAAVLVEAGARHSIIAAAASGDASTIDSSIVSGAALDSVGDDGNSALHTAVLHCHESSHHAVIHALVRAGVDVNARNCLGHTPLFLATGPNKAAAQDLLRSLGAKLTIFEAAVIGDVAAIEEFVANGGDVNMRDTLLGRYGGRSETALHQASRCVKLNCVEALLKMKADVNACDGDGKSPVQWAQDSLAKTQEIAQNPSLFHHHQCVDTLRSGVYELIFQALKAAGATLSVQEQKKLSAHTVTHATAVEVMRYHGSVTVTRHRGGGCIMPDYSLQFHNFNTFVADVQLRGGCFYFEIHILHVHVSQFGFCTAGFEARDEPRGQGVGDDDMSWAVDGYRRQKWHNDECGSFGGPWCDDDVIGFAIDMRQAGAAVMLVSVNGSFKPPNGVAFKGISAPFLSPALTASGRGAPHPSGIPWYDDHQKPEQYRVNFGERTFKFAPPNDANYMSVHTYNLLQRRR